MSDFARLAPSRNRERSEFRERLARAAREMHFFAHSSSSENAAALLAISKDLAGLAMSIPLEPAHAASAGLVDASTLFATQILQLDHRMKTNSDAVDDD